MMAQQTDPTLTGAVIAQSGAPKEILKDHEKTRRKIITAGMAVIVAVDRMHEVEDKMLTYLSSTQGVVQNPYQTKRVAELTTVEIPRNMSLLRQSLSGHLEGTTTVLLVSDELMDATTQMVSLHPFMERPVTNSMCNVSGYNVTDRSVNEKCKVNPSSSTERYYIVNEVVTKPETINTGPWLLAWQVRTYLWSDLWFGPGPEGWTMVVSGKAIVNGLIYE